MLKVHVVSGVPDEAPSGTSVIVDVLRSSSTIVTALSNGAKAVIPFTNIREAVMFRAASKQGSAVLVGERNGITPKGFDYNISPFDMSRKNVDGKVALYSSSNLTRVLGRLRKRNNVIIGGIINAKATSDYLRSTGSGVTIIACGTFQGPAIEDLAGAGAIASSLMTEDLSDEALVAVGLYGNPHWRSLVKRGLIAKRLLELGFKRDVDFCLSPDISSVVPVVRANKILNLGRVKKR